MKLRFLPDNDNFFNHLSEQAAMIVQGTQLLADLCANWSSESPQHARISDLQTNCDKLRHDIVLRIGGTFVTPIDREDIHAIATILNELLGYVHSLAMQMQVYNIQVIPTPCITLTTLVSSSAKVARDLVAQLSRFDDCAIYRKHMQELASEADTVYRNALAGLFRGGHDPIDVIQWKGLYDNLKVVVERCQDVCDVVESIAIKHA